MRCELCNKKNATVHLTEIVQSQKKELHLCDVCARKQGIVQKITASPFELLSKLAAPKQSKEGKQFAALTCDQCGLTYEEFRSRGRFGCSNDVKAFEPGLLPLLEKIHGATRHTGRVPGQASESVKIQEQLASLRRDLQESKRAEDYERCAQIRDQISELEEKMRA